VLVFGTDQRITSGPAATTAAFKSADHIRASGHNGCIQRPDTWLHPNASRKRQILFPCTAGAVHTCTAGAVHTWHEAAVCCGAASRRPLKSNRRVSRVAQSRLRTWPCTGTPSASLKTPQIYTNPGSARKKIARKRATSGPTGGAGGGAAGVSRGRAGVGHQWDHPLRYLPCFRLVLRDRERLGSAQKKIA
jgi:hypothetical protein